MTGLNLGIVLFLGLVFGSFATALAYRLPRGISMCSKKRSACPRCEKNLCVNDLIPLFSWLYYRGKCRQCGAPIGLQYPVIELATLLLCLLFYTVYGLDAYRWPVYLLAPVLVSMADIDLRYKILPDSLNLALFGIGVLFFVMQAWEYASPLQFLTEQAAGALGGAVFYGVGAFVLRAVAAQILKKEPMGLGDVKFFTAAGVWLGVRLEVFSTFLIVAGVAGVVCALLWQRYRGEDEFPFGPSLILAFIAVLYLFPVAYG